MGFGDRWIPAIARIDSKYFIGLSLAAILLPFNYVTQAQPIRTNSQTQLVSEQSIIYVNPQTGNDIEGNGTQQLPLRTITQALKLAQPNTTIDLAAGTYSEATGETFPIIIRENVTIKGSAGGKGHNIIIRGNGYFISPTGAGQQVAIAALENAGAIIGLTVINSHSRGHGLWIESANPIVASNTFTNNGNTGVSVNGNSSPVIEDNVFYNNAGNGLLVYGTSRPKVNNNIFQKTGFGVSAVQSAAPTLIGNNFTDNRIGIILEGNSQVTLRNNQIENSLETGLTAISQARADLGTASEPGNNIFRNNHQFDIQNASSNPILAAGTQISGSTAGNIDLYGESNFTAANTASNSPLASDRPLLELQPEIPDSRLAANTTTEPPQAVDRIELPSPPPVREANTEEREYVFNAPEPSSQPVPFPPQTSLDTNVRSSILSSTTSTGVKYRVLVEATDSSQQTTVRSLYPEAFSTVYQGKSMLQVGAFSNKTQAETTMYSLQNLGLNTYILD